MSTNMPKIIIDNLFDLERLDETLGKYVELDSPIELEFSEIELSGEHINKLKEVLQKNSKVNIKTIKFSNTGISAEGLKIISEIMDEKPNLQVITENFHFNREVIKRPPLSHLIRHLDISAELKSVEDLYKVYSKKVIERRELQLEAVKNDLERYLDALFENEKISEEDIAKIDEFIEDPNKFIDSEGKLSSEIGTILFNKVKIEGLINKLFKFRDQWKSMNELQSQLKDLQKKDALDALTSLVDMEFNYQLAKRDLSYDEGKAKKENKGRMDALELLNKEKEEPKIGKIFEEMNRKESEWNEEWLKIENESAKRTLTLTSPAMETQVSQETDSQEEHVVKFYKSKALNVETEKSVFVPLPNERVLKTKTSFTEKDLKKIIKDPAFSNLKLSKDGDNFTIKLIGDQTEASIFVKTKPGRFGWFSSPEIVSITQHRGIDDSKWDPQKNELNELFMKIATNDKLRGKISIEEMLPIPMKREMPKPVSAIQAEQSRALQDVGKTLQNSPETLRGTGASVLKQKDVKKEDRPLKEVAKDAAPQKSSPPAPKKGPKVN